MGDTIFKQPRINHPQYSPIAPNQKEYYKHEHPHAVHVAPPKHDSSSSFDDEEDQFFKKLRLRNDNPAPFFGNPILTHPSTIKIAEGVNAIEAKPIGNDPSKVKPLDETTQSPIDYSDSDMDKKVFEQILIMKRIFDEMTGNLFSEIRILQKLQKDLHLNRDEFMKKLEEQGFDSETLSWIQWGTTITTLGLTVLCFAATVVTGGLSAILGGLSVAAGMADGGVRTVNTFHNIKTQAIQGELEGNSLTGKLNRAQIEDIFSRYHVTLEKINNCMADAIRILNNRPTIIF